MMNDDVKPQYFHKRGWKIFLFFALVFISAAIIFRARGLGVHGVVLFFLIAVPTSVVWSHVYGMRTRRLFAAYFVVVFALVYLFSLGFGAGAFFGSLLRKTVGGLVLVQDGKVTLEAYVHFFVTLLPTTLIYCVGHWLGFESQNSSSKETKR